MASKKDEKPVPLSQVCGGDTPIDSGIVLVDKAGYQKLVEAASGIRLLMAAIIANGILSRLNRAPEQLAAEVRQSVDALEAAMLSN